MLCGIGIIRCPTPICLLNSYELKLRLVPALERRIEQQRFDEQLEAAVELVVEPIRRMLPSG